MAFTIEKPKNSVGDILWQGCRPKQAVRFQALRPVHQSHCLKNSKALDKLEKYTHLCERAHFI